MKEYLDIVEHVIIKGKWKGNRTGVRTLTLPNQIFSYDMSNDFPLLTTKKMPIKTIAIELEGFIKGITDKRWYQERNCGIWSSWCNQQQIPDELYLLDKDEKECYKPINGQKKLDWQKENPDLGKIYWAVWN